MKLYNSPYAFASYYNQMIYTARVLPCRGAGLAKPRLRGQPLGQKIGINFKPCLQPLRKLGDIGYLGAEFKEIFS